MVNQLEINPGYTQEAAVVYSQANDILVQAWSPLGRQRVLQAKLLVELAEKYQVSPARICLRYELQKGINPIPKASALERMQDNMKIFDFTISTEDMHRLNTLPQIGWSGEHPDYERVPVKEVDQIYNEA
jgi:diketogulonate reductase-like aldo/keto reductase